MGDFHDVLQAALTEENHFEAVGLVEPGGSDILFLQTIEDAVHGLSIGLERFLHRIAADRDSHHQLEQVNNVIFYDIEQRQLVCNMVQTKDRRYILVVVVAHQKTYKQATRRLIKKLQDSFS